MRNKSFLYVIIILFTFFVASCGSLVDLVGGSGATDTPDNSDENNVQASLTTAVDELNDAVSSSSSVASASVSALVTGTSNLSYALKRFQCEETTQATESYNCGESPLEEDEMTRSVTFTDCGLANAYFDDAVLNGSFDNSVEDAGAGFCGSGTYIYFGKMVADGSSHHHATGANGMVTTWTNARDKEVVSTRTADRTVEFSDSLDANKDGVYEETTSTLTLSATHSRTIDGTEVHNVTIQTMDDTLTAQDEDENDIEIEVTKPVATITIDQTSPYRFSERTWVSGHRIIDHNLAELRVIVEPGDDGLTHVAGTCAPYEGSLTFTVYEYENNTMGQEVGTGQVTYTNGNASATYEGTPYTFHTRPCH